MAGFRQVYEGLGLCSQGLGKFWQVQTGLGRVQVCLGMFK